MRSRSPLFLTFALPGTLLAQDPGPASPPKPSTELSIPGVRKLTVGGQYRLRYENQIDLDLDDDTRPDGNDFFTQRARLSLGFDFGEELGAFLQLQDVREFGEETSTLDDSADGLDMHQAYVDLKKGLGGSTRLGRQELALGEQRLVGALDWKNQARSFDGFTQQWVNDEGSKLEAWAFQVRETLPATTTPAGNYDDQWFLGVQRSSKPMTDTVADVYLMFLQDDGTAPGASAHRFTLGTRWLWSTPAWELGAELVTQFGEQAGADIPIGDTYAAHAHVTKRIDCECKAWIRGEVNVASGNDPNTADNERFNNLFPTAHAHWGMLDLALWENMFNGMVQIGFKPCEKADLSASWNFFRSMEARDSFGGPNGTVVPAGTTDSNTIGNEIDVIYTRQLDLASGVKTAVQIGYGVFLPGAAPDSIGRDSTGHFVYAQFDLKF